MRVTTLVPSGFSAIAGVDVDRVTVRGCTIELGVLAQALGNDAFGRWPAIYLLGDDLLVEDNRIIAIREAPLTGGPPTFTHTAMGGVLIGGGSERVLIRRNRIERGNGNGITLGSVAWIPKALQGKPFKEIKAGWEPAAPC